MNKEQHLTYELGITNVPSDATCDDNGLEESMGMVYADGEHRVIQKPVGFLDGLGVRKLLFVHKHSDEERYICLKSNQQSNQLVWGTRNGQGQYVPKQTGVDDVVLLTLQSGEEPKITANGKTLIVASSAGLSYLLWKQDGYKIFGNQMPDIKVSFSLADGELYMGETKGIEMGDGVLNGYEIDLYGSVGLHGSGSAWAKYEQGKNALIGIVSLKLNEVKKQKKFAFPFWVRYALRLYDGTHSNISNPILMLPTVRNNWRVYNSEDNGDYKEMDDDAGGWHRINYTPYCMALHYEVSVPSGVNLDDWTDIIRGVDVFVSEEVKNFDMEGNWTIQNFGISRYEANPLFNGVTPLFDCCGPTPAVEERQLAMQGANYKTLPIPDITTNRWLHTYYQPTLLSDDEIMGNLVENSVFYKLFELDMNDLTLTGDKDSRNRIKTGTLENIKNQQQLEYDDYFSHTSIVPSVIKTYNSRLHVANVKRGFFDGYEGFSFTSYVASPSNTSLIYYVYINSESGERIVRKFTSTTEIEKVWFYYPDPRAYKVEIFKVQGSSHTRLLSASLKEHPHLNGAYYFGLLPDSATLPEQGASASEPTVSTAPESLENQLIVSEANNPFVFTAHGYVSVGNGNILGLATQTEALSDGTEFGTQPLFVFTDRGLWSLFVDKTTGMYISATPMHREVVNNIRSITETDGAVFFSSAKGLMLISGSQVKCVSEQLSGKSDAPFTTFLKDAFIAYDYRDSLLWIFDGIVSVCWIYNIKSGTFARYDFGINNIISNVVADYPDYLLQSGNKIFSLLERPDINSDEEQDNSYSATLITRSIKFDSALTLKSIMRMRNIYELNDNGSLSVSIFAKNDLNSAWRELTHLRGTPWKYYQLRYSFSSLKATDRFAGTMLITQERYTNKPR